MQQKEYKIEKNVPLVRHSGITFDKTNPEYVVMTKMKVGESFEFPRTRIGYVLNCRQHFIKEGSPLCFATTTKLAFENNPSKLTGRCWRVEDNSRKPRNTRNKKR